MVKELNGHGTIDISLGSGQKDQIFVRNTHVRDTIHQKNRIVTVLFGGHYLGAIVGYFGSGNIIFEAPVNEYLAFYVDEDDLTYHLKFDSKNLKIRIYFYIDRLLIHLSIFVVNFTI
jgi:hypothetical protein